MSETIKLVRTCDSCPEQYDAYLGDEKVGYLRLRHGHFRVECPDNGGQLMYEAHPHGDGCFDADERDDHLRQAALSIMFWASLRGNERAQPYEIVSGTEIPRRAS